MSNSEAVLEATLWYNTPMVKVPHSTLVVRVDAEADRFPLILLEPKVLWGAPDRSKLWVQIVANSNFHSGPGRILSRKIFEGNGVEFHVIPVKIMMETRADEMLVASAYGADLNKCTLIVDLNVEQELARYEFLPNDPDVRKSPELRRMLENGH